MRSGNCPRANASATEISPAWRNRTQPHSHEAEQVNTCARRLSVRLSALTATDRHVIVGLTRLRKRPERRLAQATSGGAPRPQAEPLATTADETKLATTRITATGSRTGTLRVTIRPRTFARLSGVRLGEAASVHEHLDDACSEADQCAGTE